MGRKKFRPDPFAQGVIGLIYKHFFGPLVQYKPEDMDLSDWMAHLFDVKNREITRYRATRPFKMPGLYYLTPWTKVQGIGYRRVPEKAELWVRTDASNPDSVDVEWLGGRGEKDQMFSLTGSEWGWIRLRLREASRRGRRPKEE